MRRLALLAALATPALACDPDDFSAHLSAVCAAALEPARTWIAAVQPRATGPEQAAIAAALAAATAACDTGDPNAGAAEAVRLARLAGRIEARIGDASPIWPMREAAR